jgi:hypothetical protein
MGSGKGEAVKDWVGKSSRTIPDCALVLVRVVDLCSGNAPASLALPSLLFPFETFKHD